MTIKHTPGPWYAPASQFGYVTATDTDGNPITICTTRTEADARLIAAAPELAIAVQDLLDWLDDGNRQLSEACEKDVRAARAALAKAQGNA